MAEITRYRDPSTGRFISAASAVPGESLYEVIVPGQGLLSRAVLQYTPELEAPPQADLEPNWNVVQTDRTEQWRADGGLDLTAARSSDTPDDAQRFRVIMATDESAYKKGVKSSPWLSMDEYDDFLDSLDADESVALNIIFDTH